MKRIYTTEAGTPVYEVTEAEWKKFEDGPYGECKGGCGEANAYCQCETSGVEQTPVSQGTKGKQANRTGD